MSMAYNMEQHNRTQRNQTKQHSHLLLKAASQSLEEVGIKGRTILVTPQVKPDQK